MDSPDGIILSVSSFKLTIEERSFFMDTNPLGFVLFKRNFKNLIQLKKLISELKKLVYQKISYFR